MQTGPPPPGSQAALASYVGCLPYRIVGLRAWGIGSSHTIAASDLAAWLLADTEFEAFRLGDFLESADGQALAHIVEASLPYPYRLEARLVVDALKLAGEARREKQQRRATVWLLAAAAVIAFAVFGGSAR